MKPEIYRLYADNKPLPKGTRILTTSGGIPTGGNHELSDNVLASANSVPNHLSDYVPFWILGWKDLHESLFVPKCTICGDSGLATVTTGQVHACDCKRFRDRSEGDNDDVVAFVYGGTLLPNNPVRHEGAQPRSCL